MSVNPAPPMPGGMPQPLNADGTVNIEAWNQYVQAVYDAYTKSSGFEKQKLAAQYEDAAKARDNAVKLEQMRNRTSRYGVDAQTRVSLAELEQKQRQFDATHGLEIQKLGLDRAKTAVEWMSTPDRWAQAGAFLDLSGRVLTGQPGAGTYGRGITPQANTAEGFAVLQAGGDPYAGRGSAVGAGAGGSGADARVKALKAVIDAAPPSATPGHDANDFAVMQAARAIYSMNLTPQQQATIGSSKEYQAMLGSAGRMQGRSPDEWWRQQQATRPGQGSARRA